MKNFNDRLLQSDSPDHILRVLQSWRLWVFGAVIGALLGWGVYALFPPPFRAQGSLVVDYNIEDFWSTKLNIQYAFFYQRETKKLKAIAYSDETLEIVTAQIAGVSIQDLRSGKLILSYPYEGVWHFWADDVDPLQAEILVKAWVEAFDERVHNSIEVAPELDTLRKEFNQFLSENPDIDKSHPDLDRYFDQLTDLSKMIDGVSPYIDISFSQTDSLPVNRSVSASTYLLVGSFVGAGVAVLTALFFLSQNNKTNRENTLDVG